MGFSARWTWAGGGVSARAQRRRRAGSPATAGRWWCRACPRGQCGAASRFRSGGVGCGAAGTGTEPDDWSEASR